MYFMSWYHPYNNFTYTSQQKGEFKGTIRLSISFQDVHKIKFQLFSFNLMNDLDFDICFSKQIQHTDISTEALICLLIALVAHFSVDLDMKIELVPAT